MDLSQYLAGLVSDWIAGSDMPSAPSTIYIDLLDNSIPPVSILSTITGSANRQILPLNAKIPGGIDGYIRTSNGVVTFISSATGNATISNVGVYDAITGGNELLLKDVAPTPVTIGDRVRILDEQYTVLVD